MAGTRRLPGRASGRPRALGELRHGERAAWIALLRLVVVDVALHAAGPRPSALPMTLPAHSDRGKQYVRGVRARGRLVALGAGERTVRPVIEHAVRQPPRGDRGRRHARQPIGRGAEGVTELALLLEHHALGALELRRRPLQRRWARGPRRRRLLLGVGGPAQATSARPVRGLWLGLDGPTQTASTRSIRRRLRRALARWATAARGGRGCRPDELEVLALLLQLVRARAGRPGLRERLALLEHLDEERAEKRVDDLRGVVRGDHVGQPRVDVQWMAARPTVPDVRDRLHRGARRLGLMTEGAGELEPSRLFEDAKRPLQRPQLVEPLESDLEVLLMVQLDLGEVLELRAAVQRHAAHDVLLLDGDREFRMAGPEITDPRGDRRRRPAHPRQIGVT